MTIHKSVTIRQFTAGTLFKILAIGCYGCMAYMGVFFGILAFFGAHTVRWNSEFVTGPNGFLMSLVISFALATVLTFIGWIGFSMTFWLFSLFSNLQINYLPVHEPVNVGSESVEQQESVKTE